MVPQLCSARLRAGRSHRGVTRTCPALPEQIFNILERTYENLGRVVRGTGSEADAHGCLLDEAEVQAVVSSVLAPVPRVRNRYRWPVLWVPKDHDTVGELT